MRRAVKVLLQHIALAHRTWLPLGVLPAAHLHESRALLGMLVGAHLPALLLQCLCTLAMKRIWYVDGVEVLAHRSPTLPGISKTALVSLMKETGAGNHP